MKNNALAEFLQFTNKKSIAFIDISTCLFGVVIAAVQHKIYR